MMNSYIISLYVLVSSFMIVKVERGVLK